MSRSGYSYEFEEGWGLYRGAVASAIRGKRGQKFLRELLSALDDMPIKRLISGELERAGEFCAMRVAGDSKGIDMSGIEPTDICSISDLFDIAHALTSEVVYMNDEAGQYTETPENRWLRMRKWAQSELLPINRQG